MKMFIKLLAILLAATGIKQMVTTSITATTVPVLTQTQIVLNLPISSDSYGYSVALQNGTQHLNVACVFDTAQQTGHIITLNESNVSESLGLCDTRQLTLHQDMGTIITLRVMVDGQLVIPQATQVAKQVTLQHQTEDCSNRCRQILFDFTS